jgi:hypothetical protein
VTEALTNMSNAALSFHGVKLVNVKKKAHEDKDGKIRFEVLDIELLDNDKNSITISAFLNKGDEGYQINLI